MNTILVVEDERYLREAIISYLALEEIGADGAATLQEARELMFKGSYTVVVLDLNLPDGDGVEFARELPETTGIVIVSARGALHQRLEGLRTGADAYLVKPIDLPELVVIVTNILERLEPASVRNDTGLLKEAKVTWEGAYVSVSPSYVDGGDKQVIDFPPVVSGASGSLEFLPLGCDIVRCSTVYSPASCAEGSFHEIATITMTLSEPALVITAIETGQVRVLDAEHEAHVELQQDSMLFEITMAPSLSIALDAMAESKLRILCISRTLLYNILEEESITSLKQQLQLARDTGTSLMQVPKMVTTLFHACIPENFESDKQRLLGVQSRILSFLHSLSESLAYSSQLTRQERLTETIHRLYEELLQPTSEGMTLQELALRFNCSPKMLNDEFRKLYGQSISSFQLSRRMLDAHEELLSTTTPIKAIAHKCGYSHVNHFTTAFRKHFGYTPGSLRK